MNPKPQKPQKPNTTLASALWTACALTLLTPKTSHAAQLTYGGRLTEENGKPLEGPINLKIRLYH